MRRGFWCAVRPACWGLAAAIGLLLGNSPAAGANRQSRANREPQENAARKACLIGDYANGVSILADLFIKHKDPVYIFNQGRCLEQSLRYRDAIGRFEEFLRINESSQADSDARSEAQTHISDCKAKLLDEEKAQTPRPVPPPEPPSDPQPLPKQGPTVEIVDDPKAAAEPAKGGGGLVIAGLVTGGVGVAAVIAGVAFNLKANSMSNEMEGTVDAYTPSKDSSQKSYQTLTWIGYGVGAACIATGTILTVVGMTRSSNRSDVALVPAVGPGQAGVLLHGGF
jgi:tetratricopeptide (TPR) repeat protein